MEIEGTEFAPPVTKVLRNIMRLYKKYPYRKLKLLVANDNQFQLLIITSILAKLPYIGTIDEATNGQEAIELVKTLK